MPSLQINSRINKIYSMPSAIKYSDAEDSYVYYVNNLYYGALHYDSYRKYYYRLVKRPAKVEYTKNDLKTGVAVEQQWSVIIADENFNKIGETDLPKDVWGGLVLVSKEGLVLQKSIDNEDFMTFSIFELMRNNE
ncbi:DUF4221 family protein [Spirosoma sp. BT702]|uniref:DUF4221 family protein n=1 Tax=Spirosoma profusum TaxID=2771354 RepID=A0A927AV77_9BACT|nr:DUF4221 family protein [Spirosoma profusum]MBD2705001.1 DUF4221 family protein [Spirosoma profusum]